MADLTLACNVTDRRNSWNAHSKKHKLWVFDRQMKCVGKLCGDNFVPGKVGSRGQFIVS